VEKLEGLKVEEGGKLIIALLDRKERESGRILEE
jgi:hypothetical protein